MTSGYKIPDMTGTDPNYAVKNDVTMMVTSGSRLAFPESIYSSSLVITPFGSTTPLVQGTDYNFTTSDIDYTTMAKAMASDPSWKSQLVKSFTIVRPQVNLPLKISMSYQCFYLMTPTVPITNASGTVDFNPDVAAMLVNNVASLQQIINSGTSSTGFTTQKPVVLQYDINETNPNNVITDEVWSIDTFNGQSTIFPVQGPFFRDSVSVSLTGNSGVSPTTLTEGTDYLCLGFNPVLTSLSTNNSGIYTLIKILKQFSGQVSVNYHAVGGEVTANTVGLLAENIEDIKTYLSNTYFLTQQSLSDSPTIKIIQQQIQELNAKMRAQVDNATYGDSTNGVTVVKQIRASNTDEHWFTIASLYQVATSNPQQPVLTDHDGMNLTVQMKNANYMADVSISFNKNNPNYPFSVNVTNMIGEPGFVLWGNTNTTSTIYPKWRVVYNQDPNAFTGAYLQLGMSLPQLTETLTIEDRSGVQSTWILNTATGTNAAPLTPEDNGFTLPDNQSIWSSTASGSMSVAHTQMAQNNTGYMVLAGAYNLSSFNESNQGVFSQTALIPNTFLLQDIKKLDLWFTDSSTSPPTRFRIEMPMAYTASTTSTSGGVLIPVSTQNANSTPLWMKITLTSTSVGVTITITLSGNTSTADVIALRYLIAHV